MYSDIFSNKVNRLFLFLAGIFLTNAFIAEFMGVKIFSLEESLGFDSMNWSLFGVEGLGFNLSAGVLLWPVVFVLTDVINEYFGIRGVRLLSNAAVLLILYGFIMVYFAIALEPNDWWQYEAGILDKDPTRHINDMDMAFRRILGQGLWIIVGSLIAFLIGQIVDVFTFHRIKKVTGEGKVWLRATGSTLVSQLIDSFIVLFIAFYIGADWDIVRVVAIGLVNYTYKFAMAILLTPLIYLAHFLIDKFLGEQLAHELKEKAAL